MNSLISIKKNATENYCFAIKICGTRCAYCKKDIQPDEVFFALSNPYHAALHSICLPYFDYEKLWPHEAPLVAFK